MAVCIAGGVKASQQMITAMPEIREQELQEDDEFLILACDGIWENLSSQQVWLLPAQRHAHALSAGDSAAWPCTRSWCLYGCMKCAGRWGGVISLGNAISASAATDTISAAFDRLWTSCESGCRPATRQPRPPLRCATTAWRPPCTGAGI